MRWIRQRGWQPVTILLSVGVALLALAITQQIPALNWIGLALAIVGFVGLLIVFAKPTPLAPVEAKEAAASAFWSRPASLVGVGPSPAFPASMPDWREVPGWHETMRVFDHLEWMPVHQPNGEPFPSTQNGCDHQRFTIRWRLLADNSLIDAAKVNAANEVEQTVRAASGWMILDGCGHPAFRFAEEPLGSTMLDLAVEVRRWVPAV